MHTEYVAEPPMWRSYAKKFTNLYPSFHDYVAKLKHDKQLEERKVHLLRFKEKRDEERLKEQEIAEEIKREKQQKLAELKEKIKETKEKIKIRDIEQAKKRENDLFKKMNLMKQVILRKVQIYDTKNLEYWTPKNKSPSNGKKTIQFSDISRRNQTEEAVRFDTGERRSSILKLTQVGDVRLDSEDNGYYEFLNGKDRVQNKTEEIDTVLHDAQMLPKKPDYDKYVKPVQKIFNLSQVQKYVKMKSFKRSGSKLNNSVL